MTTNKPTAFERLVVLLNPKSSNAAQANTHIAALQKSYPGKVVVKTFIASGEANRLWLQKHLRPDDILVLCGGDGTHGAAIEDLMHPSMPKALRSVRVLPLGIGQMNDLAHVLNGKYFNNPGYVLRHGRELAVYPMVCTFTPLEGPTAGQTQTHLAVYELGFGVSSQISQKSNDPAFRAMLQKQTKLTRTISFFEAGSKIVRDSQYFDITYKGTRQAILELTVASGHILGGYWRLPARLSRREFFFAISADKSFLGAARTVAALMTNTYKKGAIVTSLDFTLHQPTLAHFGGETLTPPTPCRVHIEHHKKPVIMLATSPKA